MEEFCESRLPYNRRRKISTNEALHIKIAKRTSPETVMRA